MKVLLINGSPNEHGSTMRALLECKQTLEELEAETKIYNVGKNPRRACITCGNCKTTKKCVFDDLDELCKDLTISDAVIIGTPTHYASIPGNLLSILERILYSSKHTVENKPIAVIGTGRRGCISEAIRDVKKFFEFASCPIISGSYPAILYSTGFDNAEKDKEGLKNMRSISKNLFYIANCIQIAKEKGIYPPKEEIGEKTDISSII